MNNPNLIYQIGLTLIKGIGNIIAKQIIQTLNDPEAFFREKSRILERIPGITPRIIAEIHNPEVLRRAEKEVLFIEKNQIKTYFISDEDYPYRFKECIDSPVILYFKGNANLNASKIISIVGTRHSTIYGKEITEKFVSDLKKQIPDIIIVSGLAYGIDIIAHKTALKEDLPTIGVLAHGLDRIYPFQHRQTALEMLECGGLLTDFMSETNPDRQNFVKRNRIVAGISDCTVIMESAEKGGALITAHIADSYNKDIFAIPGKVQDLYSRGCNNLIREKRASLVQSAEDLVREMGWKVREEKTRHIQRTIMLDLSPEQQTIINILSESSGMHLNLLAIETNTPISKLSATLFELEMNGIVRALPGGIYKVN